MAESISNYFAQSSVKTIIEQLKKAGLTMKEPTKDMIESEITGKTFVITGSLESLSRSDAEQKISEHGGSAVGSVSKKTDYLICGKEPGSKFDKAKELEVKIIYEKEFLELIK